MNKIMIFGSGQAGNMISNWISGDFELLGFIDNNPNLCGKYKDNKRIYSAKESVKIMPDIIVIAVLNKEAAEEIQLQLKLLDYKGIVFNINDFKQYIDIRLASLRLIASEINEQKLEGEVAELGVYKGKFASEINKLFPNKKLYLFDTFEGFYDEDLEVERSHGYLRAKEGDFSDTNVELVKNKLPYKEQAEFIKGHFPESIKEDLPSFCFVSLDTDLYKPTYEGLKIFYPKLVRGGMIIVHDYNSSQFPGVKKAVKEYCNANNIFIVPLCDMHGSAVLIKS
ncbi:TylF/MycF/NovP-related O-methyltransferase [Terrisporobacter vanillatitrophus]|uniref:TylF/MycF/NovP-related O-methyltransferase n=1 Tax=Terrisporobacter vanillatitrophus TaxID=3058402 RepID=UPI0033670E61